MRLTFHVPGSAFVLLISLSHLPAHYFKPPHASLTLSVSIIYCCVISHLGVSGVTQWSFYCAHRFCVRNSYGACCCSSVWGLSWKTGDWRRCECLGTGILWRFLHPLTYLPPGLWWLESWAQLGLLTEPLNMWSPCGLGLLTSGPLGSKSGCLETQHFKKLKQELHGLFWPPINTEGKFSH